MHLSLLLPDRQTFDRLEFTAKFDPSSSDEANGGAIIVRDPSTNKETTYRLVVKPDCSLRLRKIR